MVNLKIKGNQDKNKVQIKGYVVTKIKWLKINQINHLKSENYAQEKYFAG